MTSSSHEDADRSAKRARKRRRGSETSAPREKKKVKQESATSPSLQERYDSFATCPAPENPRYRHVLDSSSWREITSLPSWNSEQYHRVTCGFFPARFHCESCGVTEVDGKSWRRHHRAKHAPIPPNQQPSKETQSRTPINAGAELVIVIAFDSFQKKIGITVAELVGTTQELPRCSAEVVFRQIPQLKQAQKHMTPIPEHGSKNLTCTASFMVKMTWKEYEILGRRVDVMNSMMTE